MDDGGRRRLAKVKAEIDELRRSLERARVARRRRSGRAAPRRWHRRCARATASTLPAAKGEPVGAVADLRHRPAAPGLRQGRELAGCLRRSARPAPRPRGERLERVAARRAARGASPSSRRSCPDGRDADDVVQVHLEHRLVRRLLGRFLSQGFQSGLNRVCVIIGPGAQPRVVLIGRIALYGPGAARLHEEILPVTAIWTRSRTAARSRSGALGERGEETTLDQLEEALTGGRSPPRRRRRRGRSRSSTRTSPICCRRWRSAPRTPWPRPPRSSPSAAARRRRRWTTCSHQQRQRIAKAEAGFDDRQLELPGIAEERSAGRRAPTAGTGGSACERIEQELQDEPARIARRLRGPRATAGAGRPRLSLAGDGVIMPMATEHRPRSRSRMARPRPADRPRRRRPTVHQGAGRSSPSGRRRPTPAAGRGASRPEGRRARLADPWAFFAAVLGWDARYVAGAPGRPDRCRTISPSPCRSTTRRSRRLGGARLRGRRALAAPGPARAGRRRSRPPRRAEGWEATPHQRFERLLRETGVLAGVMITDRELRLVYAPRGETSGWLALPAALARHRRRPADARRASSCCSARFRLFNDAGRPAPARRC